jgi:hypothetical protein
VESSRLAGMPPNKPLTDEGRQLSVGVRRAGAARLFRWCKGRRAAPAVLLSTITFGLRR